jgi:hypothetical protein
MITPTYKLHSQVDSFIFNDENDVLVGEWEVVVVVVVRIVVAAAAVASYPMLCYAMLSYPIPSYAVSSCPLLSSPPHSITSYGFSSYYALSYLSHPMLLGLADGRLNVWYQPFIAFTDRDLVPLTTSSAEAKGPCYLK